jgi:hypothetical protein
VFDGKPLESRGTGNEKEHRLERRQLPENALVILDVHMKALTFRLQLRTLSEKRGACR